MRPTKPLPQPPPWLVWGAAFKHIAPALPQKEQQEHQEKGA